MKAFELSRVVKTYPEFQLGPLDLDLEPGLVLGYVGPNGSGKTTTIHCLTGLVKKQAGEIRIFGHRNEPNDPRWKYEVGYVGDVHVFYERWSAEKNLEFLSQFYPNWSDSKARELARRFDLPLKKKAKELSRGNRIKLSLVGVLARSPRLLLLDEPTAGLDPVVRSEVLETLFEILESGDRAIFYSTHILSDISRLADELAFLNDGRIQLRSAKDDLTDRWRRISFRLSSPQVDLAAAVSHRVEGSDHRVITSDFEATLPNLHDLGAENIYVNRMGIDEIAVQILKGGRNVAVTSS